MAAIVCVHLVWGSRVVYRYGDVGRVGLEGEVERDVRSVRRMRSQRRELMML